MWRYDALQVGPLLLQYLATSVSVDGKRLWGDPSVTVRDSAAWTLGKILGTRWTCTDETLLSKTVEVLCSALVDKPRVAVNVTYVRGCCVLCEVCVIGTISPRL
jgi:hypothetical protein